MFYLRRDGDCNVGTENHKLTFRLCRHTTKFQGGALLLSPYPMPPILFTAYRFGNLGIDPHRYLESCFFHLTFIAYCFCLFKLLFESGDQDIQ
jgi:hypothetical protein